MTTRRDNLSHRHREETSIGHVPHWDEIKERMRRTPVRATRDETIGDHLHKSGWIVYVGLLLVFLSFVITAGTVVFAMLSSVNAGFLRETIEWRLNDALCQLDDDNECRIKCKINSEDAVNCSRIHIDETHEEHLDNPWSGREEKDSTEYYYNLRKVLTEEYPKLYKEDRKADVEFSAKAQRIHFDDSCDQQSKRFVSDYALIKFEEDFEKGYKDTLANIINNGMDIDIAGSFIQQAQDEKNRQWNSLNVYINKEAEYKIICDDDDYRDFLDSAIMDAHDKFNTLFTKFNNKVERERKRGLWNATDVVLSAFSASVFVSTIIVAPLIILYYIFCTRDFEIPAGRVVCALLVGVVLSFLPILSVLMCWLPLDK